MAEQLIQKNCSTGEYQDINPNTTFDAITDLNTGRTLDEVLEDYNHLYLQFKDNSKAATRLQVPVKYRRKGLWITYTSCQNNVVTEYYNSDDYSDKAWKDNCNWVSYLDKNKIDAVVKEYLTWYKA